VRVRPMLGGTDAGRRAPAWTTSGDLTSSR